MPITKKAALRAIAAQARKRVDLPYDESAILSQSRVAEFAESSVPEYKRFADFLLNRVFRRGGHPDYDHLAHPELAGKTEEGEITTLFMDLKNFTKYCCFLSPQDVYKAKASSIETVIGVCRIYGGHLHEIPGDGVMFFFGGRNLNSVQTARNAINAASDSMETLEAVVMEEYNSKDKFPSIYPKIGVDYGNALWGAYGAHGVFEVKATAFNVDIAHKMMAQRHSKEIAVGDDLKKLLEINEEKYLTKDWSYERTLTVNGEEKSICYPTYVFDWAKWLSERADDNSDLARISIIKAPVVVTASRTQLGDAPLA